MMQTAGSVSAIGSFFDCVSASCSETFQMVALIGGEKCVACIRDQIQDPSNIAHK
ncbi:hypothetical protein DPMN_189870 [Dreissena polymorpha]|uniref:Uncharacterized protein n=1 Tax=Dreissena polymorpha TaxID=45954 RepID=A0A9D4DTK3_DREPO|nr:hypothetical protein DPMN_189870 [Dreissena polymorpha]